MSSDDRPQPRVGIAVSCAGALACLAFASGLASGFVFDDTAFFPATPRLRLPFAEAPLLSEPTWWFSRTGLAVPIFRPLVSFVLWAGIRLFGDGPLAWHALSIGLHTLCAMLVVLVARRLIGTRSLLPASIAGAVFAVHPVHVEAVAWVMAFGHLLAAALALVAVLAQLEAATRPRVAPWLLLAAASTFLAMLASEGAYVLPLLLALLDRVRRGRWSWAGASTVPALAATLLLRSRALDGAALQLSLDRVPVAASFAARYVRELVFPYPQPVYATLPRGGVATAPTIWIAAAAVAVAAVILLRTPPRERSSPAFSLAWIAVGIVPLALVGFSPTPLLAPRALYLPSIGLALLAAWGASRIEARHAGMGRGSAAAVAAALVVACNVLAREWRDDVLVYERMLAADPEHSGALVRIGQLLDDRGMPEEAERSLRDAVRVATRDPGQVEALEALGVHLGMQGRAAESEAVLRDVVARAPTRVGAWIGLGNLALQRRDLDAARQSYRRALAVDPRSYEAAYDLALVHEAAGDREGAESMRATADALRSGP